MRNELRAAKQWPLADRVRDGLTALDVTLEDGAAGHDLEARITPAASAAIGDGARWALAPVARTLHTPGVA